jgi:hypothetical protein
MQQPRQRFMMLSLIFFITNPPHCMAFVPASGALSATTMTRRTGQGACSLRSIIKTDGSEPARRSATDVVVRQPYLGFASLHFQSVPLRLTRHCGCAVEHRTLSAWRLCPLSRCLCRSSKVRELFKSMLRVCMHCSVPQRFTGGKPDAEHGRLAESKRDPLKFPDEEWDAKLASGQLSKVLFHFASIAARHPPDARRAERVRARRMRTVCCAMPRQSAPTPRGSTARTAGGASRAPCAARSSSILRPSSTRGPDGPPSTTGSRGWSCRRAPQPDPAPRGPRGWRRCEAVPA